MFFKKKIEKKTYDKENKKPVIRASICTGEMVAGFKNVHTGEFEEVMLVRNDQEINEFKSTYNSKGDIEKIY